MNIKLTKSQQGFSLVELMVGMTISLFVAGVAVSYLVTSSRNLTEKTGLDLIQENTRFALEILSSNIRQAGMVNVKNSGSDTLIPIFTQDICSADFKSGPADNESQVCNVDNGDNAFGSITMESDRIAIQMDTNATYQTCDGTSVTPATNTMERVVTVFWAGDIDQDGVSSLYCQTYAYAGVVGTTLSTYTLPTAAIPLVDGIEMLQVQYGVDTIDAGSTDPDGDVDKYVSFSNVASSETDNILAIKIGLLVSPGQAITTEQNSDNTSEEKEYRVLDGYYKSAANDRVRRQATSTTIFLPNMAS